MKFRAIPVEIEAIQWTGENFGQVREFFGNISMAEDRIFHTIEIRVYSDDDNFERIDVLNGDWLFKDITGKIITVGRAAFRLSYENID